MKRLLLLVGMVLFLMAGQASANILYTFSGAPATVGSSSTSLPSIIVLSTPTLNNILQVTFSGGLTALGAPILIGTFDSFEQTTAPARRDIIAGSAIVATTVPEPSTIALLGMSVLGLLASVRRRRG